MLGLLESLLGAFHVSLVFLLQPGSRLLVSGSGGGGSLALLHGARECIRELRTQRYRRAVNLLETLREHPALLRRAVTRVGGASVSRLERGRGCRDGALEPALSRGDLLGYLTAPLP